MSEEIGFEEPPKKPTPEIMDAEIQNMKEKAEKSVAQAEIKKEIKQEVQAPPPVYDSVPTELPEIIFHCAANWVECPKMELDEKEKQVMAKHLSNLIGNPSSKLFSLFMILVVLFSKITACKNAIVSKFKKNPAT